MAFNVVYSDKDRIEGALQDETIPRESLILTSDNENQSESYYYDDLGNLKYITKRTQFSSLLEARLWIAKYGYEGLVISIYENNTWVPYLVKADQQIEKIYVGEPEELTVLNLNGGGAFINY